MACPTCDHTMHNIGTNRSHQVFWCPRCGTIRDRNPHSTDEVRETAVPMLVQRCRDYHDEAFGCVTTRHVDLWRRCGIAESINLPTNRTEPQS